MARQFDFATSGDKTNIRKERGEKPHHDTRHKYSISRIQASEPLDQISIAIAMMRRPSTISAKSCNPSSVAVVQMMAAMQAVATWWFRSDLADGLPTHLARPSTSTSGISNWIYSSPAGDRWRAGRFSVRSMPPRHDAARAVGSPYRCPSSAGDR